jgi:hypothetical protein
MVMLDVAYEATIWIGRLAIVGIVAAVTYMTWLEWEADRRRRRQRAETHPTSHVRVSRRVFDWARIEELQ